MKILYYFEELSAEAQGFARTSASNYLWSVGIEPTPTEVESIVQKAIYTKSGQYAGVKAGEELPA